MTNGKVRVSVIAIVAALAGCSAIDGMLGKTPINSKSRKSISVQSPAPSGSRNSAGGVVVITQPRGCIRIGGRESGAPVGSNYACPPGVTPPPEPPSTIGTTGRICPSDVYVMLGKFNQLPGGVGRSLNFGFWCGTQEERNDYNDPIVPVNIGERLWVFVGSGGYSDENMLIFRLEEASGSLLFFDGRESYTGTRIGTRGWGYEGHWDDKKGGIFLFNFSVPGQGSRSYFLPGDVESRNGKTLTFTEQGKSRFGGPTFEWPCAKEEEYGNTEPTADNKYPDDFNHRFFAVGDRYVVRSLTSSLYEMDGNGDRWSTIKKIIQVVRRDGRTFKIIRKYQWLGKDLSDFYGSLADSVKGMDSFVWSVQLKAFVRNPFDYGLFGELRGFEVITEDDLDTLLAVNEGSPCGLE